MRFKLNIAFQGTATLEMEAASPEEARLLARELTLTDLAKQGQADILSLHVAAREVTPISALSGEENAGHEEEGPRKPRPSGWYRPL